MPAAGIQRKRLDLADRAQIKLAVEVREQRTAGSHFSAAPSTAASTLTSTRSGWPAKCRRAVSATCSAVEKWMNPSRRSTAEPWKTPAASAARHSSAEQIL